MNHLLLQAKGNDIAQVPVFRPPNRAKAERALPVRTAERPDLHKAYQTQDVDETLEEVMADGKAKYVASFATELLLEK